MRKLLAIFALSVVPALGLASTGPATLKADINLTDHASLQNGAKYFMNYCMGCHSLKYLRYNRMAQDLGIDDITLRKTVLLGDRKPGDAMSIAMVPADAEKWFGVPSPDLTLVTRWRSPDWVYTYLKSFYADPTRPYGVNNLMFPNTAMPFVLADLAGVGQPIMGGHGGAAPVVEGVSPATGGTLTAAQYDTIARDITAFLTYAGEPMQLERVHLGRYVLLFIGVFFVLAYALKKEYWKDVH